MWFLRAPAAGRAKHHGRRGPGAPLALGALVALAAGGCGKDKAASPTGDSDSQPACGVGDDVKTPRIGIVNGVAQPEAFPIAAGQQLAVGALMSQEGIGWDNICTATLVAPRVVLTAAHCLQGSGWSGEDPVPSDYRFAIGDDVATPQRMFTIQALHANPSYSSSAQHDVGILILTEDAVAAVPDLIPIEVNARDLAPWLVGQTVQNVGYGSTQQGGGGSNSRRWWTTEPVISVNSFEFQVDGNGYSSVCFGDSGGPSLYRFEDGAVRVIGTVSWGDQSCVDVDHFARTDYNLAWIEQPSVAGDITGCMGLTAAGRCLGEQTAQWCEGDRIVSEDCAATTKICLVDQQGLARCVPDPCQGITWQGTCVQGTAYWCEEHVLKHRRCPPCGQTCGDAGPTLGTYCVDS